MIEVHIELQSIEVLRMENLPEGSVHEVIHDDLVSTLSIFSIPTSYHQYLVAAGLYLSDTFEESSWRVVLFDYGTQVGRMECSVSRRDLQPAPLHRPSRYKRSPVI